MKGGRLAALAVVGVIGCSRPAPSTEPTQPVRVLSTTDSTPPAAADGAAADGAAADGLPATFLADFAVADARARGIAYWLQCVPTLARLRAEGRFGPAARAPRSIYCARTNDGVPIGGVYDVDSAFRVVRRLTVLRLDGARPAYTQPLDTVAITREAKLARDVNKAIAATWAKQRRPYSVVPFTRDSGRVLEAWVVPRATRTRMIVTGGDMGYRGDADGTMTLLVNRQATWKEVPLAASGPLRIVSAATDVAAVSDLVTARYQTELGRQVSIATSTVMSVLEPGFDPTTGARVVWKHALIRR